MLISYIKRISIWNTKRKNNPTLKN